MPEYILTERHEKRAELVLNRPEKRNALIVPMIDEMREAIEAENYEQASALRDQIRQTEKELAP